MRMLLARDEALPQTRRAGTEARNALTLCFPPHHPGFPANAGALVWGPVFLGLGNSEFFFSPRVPDAFQIPPIVPSLKSGKDGGPFSSIPLPLTFLPAPHAAGGG